jgi:uncharacterized protein (UPF0333 family)
MYRSQRGAVSGALIALIVVGILGAMAVMTYISNANLGNRLEIAIKAKYADNENIYANGTQKVMEIAQVPGMYAADLQKVVTAAIQGRYGPNGSQATMQWIKEAGVSLDPSMYTKIQQVIESFRNEFQQSQTALLDQCRNYETLRGNVWSGFWLNIAGYPKKDIDKMCTIVTTDKARQTFETKRDTGIQLRPAN